MINLTLLHWEHSSHTGQDQHSKLFFDFLGHHCYLYERWYTWFHAARVCRAAIPASEMHLCKRNRNRNFPFWLMKTNQFIFYQAVQSCGAHRINLVLGIGSYMLSNEIWQWLWNIRAFWGPESLLLKITICSLTSKCLVSVCVEYSSLDISGSSLSIVIPYNTDTLWMGVHTLRGDRVCILWHIPKPPVHIRRCKSR